MMTVYRYGFEEPRPVEEPRTNPLTVLVLLGAAAWWAWRQGWLGKLKASVASATSALGGGK